MNVKVSIVCPAYNAERSIEKVIESVIKQTYRSWELIVINDGSTDNTKHIVEKYLDDPRIILINQVNAGPSVSRNRGIDMAKGEWLTFIDADDWVTVDYVEILTDGISRNIDLVCAGYFECNKKFPNGILLHDFYHYFPSTRISKQEFINNLFNGVTGVLWAKLFRKSIIVQNKLNLHPELKLSEDLLFVLQYVKCIKQISIVYKNIYFYNRLEEVGLSSMVDLSYLNNIKVFNEAVTKELLEINKDIANLLCYRTVVILLKILKNNNNSVKELTSNYELISNQFGVVYHKQLGYEDKIFASLVNKKCFKMAQLFLKTIRQIKNIKHA